MICSPRSTRLGERRLQMFDGPVNDRVRRVVEHLTDDLAAYTGIGASLHLYQCGDRILIEKKVIEIPACAATFF
jgi:hypothetical protein